MNPALVIIPTYNERDNSVTFLVTYVVLRSANLVKRVLKQTGIAILERVFGLILAAIAVQFVFEGGKALLAAP